VIHGFFKLNVWSPSFAGIVTSTGKFNSIIVKMAKLVFYILQGCPFKGSVQRKLRWVENGVNRSVGASDCGAGHSFVLLFRFHLGFTIFPFPVSTAEFIGEFWKNKRSATSDVAPIVLALYRIRYWRYVDSCA
jgi:hypothetical protein